jgi:hypothetical protein
MGVRDSLASIPSFRGKFLEPEGRGVPDQIYPGRRRVPNVSGLLGHATESHYMMPPVEPSDNGETTLDSFESYTRLGSSLKCSARHGGGRILGAMWSPVPDQKSGLPLQPEGFIGILV